MVGGYVKRKIQKRSERYGGRAWDDDATPRGKTGKGGCGGVFYVSIYKKSHNVFYT